METIEIRTIYKTYRDLGYEGFYDEIYWENKKDAEDYMTKENNKEDNGWRELRYPLQIEEILVMVNVKNVKLQEIPDFPLVETLKRFFDIITIEDLINFKNKHGVGLENVRQLGKKRMAKIKEILQNYGITIKE